MERILCSDWWITIAWWSRDRARGGAGLLEKRQYFQRLVVVSNMQPGRHFNRDSIPQEFLQIGRAGGGNGALKLQNAMKFAPVECSSWGKSRANERYGVCHVNVRANESPWIWSRDRRNGSVSGVHYRKKTNEVKWVSCEGYQIKFTLFIRSSFFNAVVSSVFPRYKALQHALQRNYIKLHYHLSFTTLKTHHTNDWIFYLDIGWTTKKNMNVQELCRSGYRGCDQVIFWNFRNVLVENTLVTSLQGYLNPKIKFRSDRHLLLNGSRDSFKAD